MLKNLLYLLAKLLLWTKRLPDCPQYLIPDIRLIRKASLLSWPVIIRVMDCIWIHPDPRLDQAQTYEAINQLQLYLEYYPQSERAKEAQNIMFELQEKLALRNCWQSGCISTWVPIWETTIFSCVITAQNALKNYPYSKYREEFMFYTIRAKYELAVVSVEEKLQGRYREVVDEYYNYMNEYPEGKYVKQVQKFYDYASKRITDTY